MTERQTGARPLDDGDETGELPSGPPSAARSTESRAGTCYQAALRLLDYRARTETEMRQRLTRKGFEAGDIDAVLARLKTSGLIDDAAFARAWSDSRAASSPRSAFVIKRELRGKGVTRDTAEEAVACLDDAEAAYRAAVPRATRLAKLPPEEARRKLGDFLRRRGFSWGVAEETMNRLKDEGIGFEVDTNEATP
jgi:regulatory protein